MRNKYSVAVIEGIKRNATTYVGDSIVRKTDSRLSKGEDVVVCLPGARIEHVIERVEKIMGRGKGGTILVHVGTNNADKEGTTAIVDKYRWIQKFEADGDQRDDEAALRGRGRWIRGSVGQLCWERRNVREGRCAP